MRNLLSVKFEKYIEDFNLQYGTEDEKWKRFVNYHFFHNFSPGVLIQMSICWIRSVLNPPVFRIYMESFFC